MWRYLVVSAALLCIAGCGCTPGEIPPPPGPVVELAAVDFKVLLPGIRVEPPKAFKVDVAFVLDDSDTMTTGFLQFDGADLRKRSQVAQALMRRIVDTVEARLAVAYGGSPPAVDFAFAVARYEDFGGSFTSKPRQAGDVDDPANANNDMDARPFILNMPMLRADLPDFPAKFRSALAREAPGDGNPFVQPVGAPDPFRLVDPQSGLEALYQVAAPQNPDGTYGGFDGDGPDSRDGTLGSGAPTGLDPLRNPQTRPGDSGDVPAIGYRSAGLDGDGQALYHVTDENGNVVAVSGAPSVGSGASSCLPPTSRRWRRSPRDRRRVLAS